MDGEPSPQVAFDQYPNLQTQALAEFRDGVLDVLRSIEITIQSTFYSINEATPPANCTKIDLVSVRDFLDEWVLKHDFQTASFAPELTKNFRKLVQIIHNSNELYDKNKPEIEKIKSLETYFGEVRLLQIEVVRELEEAEKPTGDAHSLPPFESIFQKPLKFLGKISKIAEQLEQFPLLYAINGQNVDDWVAAGLTCRRPFKNVSDATAKLIDHFVDLEADLEDFEGVDYTAQNNAMVS